jgi:hypothetical protein
MFALSKNARVVSVARVVARVEDELCDAPMMTRRCTPPLKDRAVNALARMNV